MLTHVVLIKLRDGVDPGAVDALLDGLGRLPEQIPEIQSYTVGRDMGLVDGNYDLAVMARFTAPEALQTYLEHPAHRDLVRDLLDPVSAHRARIQFPTM